MTMEAATTTLINMTTNTVPPRPAHQEMPRFRIREITRYSTEQRAISSIRLFGGLEGISYPPKVLYDILTIYQVCKHIMHIFLDMYHGSKNILNSIHHCSHHSMPHAEYFWNIR